MFYKSYNECHRQKTGREDDRRLGAQRNEGDDDDDARGWGRQHA